LSTFGSRLKKIRIILQLNQQQLADKLGIKYQSISKVENDINGLSIESLTNLLREYDVNLNWLIDNKGEMFNSYKKVPKDDFDNKVEEKVTKILDKYGLTDIITK
jgi:transcriptional regulator with XRE-family HTH domain